MLQVIQETLLQVIHGTLLQVTHGTLLQITHGSLLQVTHGTLLQVTQGTLLQVTQGTLLQVTDGSYAKVDGLQLLNQPPPDGLDVGASHAPVRVEQDQVRLLVAAAADYALVSPVVGIVLRSTW